MTSGERKQGSRRLRLILLALLLVTLFAAGKYTGITDRVDADAIRALMDAAGPWGWALYVVIFAGGIHV